MNARLPSPARILRRLFLTLFLRGRSSRGLQKDEAPKSVESKLGLTLLFYALFGLMAFFVRRQPVFTISLYLHAMTFLLVAMFIAASAGEVLFNKEEGDILMHRPITARALLWAKIGVLIEIALWLAAAFNLAGFFVGSLSSPRGWIFPLAHGLSTTLEALFCAGFVVVTYELCLRWFGRERLEGLMTTVQVVVAIAAVAGSQLVPQLIGRFEGKIQINLGSWWVALLPPAWFAGVDDALSGTRAGSSWVLAAVGLTATTLVLWLAFGRLAGDYETGLQTLSEISSPRPVRSGRRRWIARLVNAPPLNWWLRDSVSRAAFLLTAAYLFRDRETKLRIYPGLAPMLVMPVVMIFQGSRQPEAGGSFVLALAGAYLGLVPLLGIHVLRYSQQWQASDLFRLAPIPGPGRLCHGARRAVQFCLTLPLVLLFGVIAWLVTGKTLYALLLLPGVIALPVYGMVACSGGKAVPLSLPIEEGKAAARGVIFIGSMAVAPLLAAIASWAWSAGWFVWLLLVETIVGATIYATIRSSLTNMRWSSMD